MKKVLEKLINYFKNKKKVVPIKTGIVYNREFISGLMTEIVNSIDEVKIGKNITITITPNMNCEFEEQFSEATDPFCTLFKENTAQDFVFYGNKTNEFVRWRGDDLCYGNYYEGAELSEGQFEILFENPESDQYDKIEIGLGLYNVEKSKMNINFSKKYVNEFIIVIWSEGKSFCHILENSNDTKSNFINILTLNKINTEWSLSVNIKCFENTEDYVNKNLTHLEINASH